MSKRKSVRFTVSEDEMLIEFVNAHDYLWDTKHKDYKNTTKRDHVWGNIAAMINKTKRECQKRWKSIRDHYKRMRKEEQTNFLVGKQKRAMYWNRLKFLDAIKEERDPLSDDMIEIVSYGCPTPAKKRRLLPKVIDDVGTQQPGDNNSDVMPEDDVDLFFRSIAMTIKKFRPELVTKTKMKIFQIVTDMEILQQTISN